MSCSSMFSVLLLVGVCALVSAQDTCKVSSTTYSSNDGLVLLQAAHIITFTAECTNNAVPVYGNLNGRTLSVVRSGDGKTYQVSWTDEMSKATSGSYDISFFDEDGFQQFKKAQRSGSSDVKALFNLSYSHSSPYRLPMFQSEFVVLLIGIVLSYYAIKLRYQIATKKI